VIEDEGKLYCEDLGETLDGILDLGLDGKTYVAARISELRERWAGALESQLAEEVTA
jgi:hypothetical protein